MAGVCDGEVDGDPAVARETLHNDIVAPAYFADCAGVEGKIDSPGKFYFFDRVIFFGTSPTVTLVQLCFFYTLSITRVS